MAEPQEGHYEYDYVYDSAGSAGEGGEQAGLGQGDDADMGVSEEGWMLQLHERIAEVEMENAALRARLESQRQLLEQLQAALAAAAPASVGRGGARRRGCWQPVMRAEDLALLAAAGEGDLQRVQALLGSSPGAAADVHAEHDAALMAACRGGHLPVVAALLDAGADVRVDHDSPLMWAARNGDVRLATLLLERGACASSLGGCALRLARAKGHEEVARLLEGRP